MVHFASAISPEVRAEIEDLLSEFSARVDEGRAATVHELFIESGCVETPQFALSSREEIRERFTARARDTSRKTRHYWSNPRFSGGADEVTVVTNVITIIAITGKPALITGGSSTDVLVRQGTGWVFKSRRLEVVFEGTLAPVETHP